MAEREFLDGDAFVDLLLDGWWRPVGYFSDCLRPPFELELKIAVRGISQRSLCQKLHAGADDGERVARAMLRDQIIDDSGNLLLTVHSFELRGAHNFTLHQ